MARIYRILLVEDNPADVYLMQATLLEAEILHELKVLQDGEEAIEYLLGLAASEPVLAPDLVILDLNMPKRNGHEVLAALRNCPAYLQLPVVVLTNSEDPEDKRRIAEMGASYVTKPANLENFFRVLEIVEVASFDFTALDADLQKQTEQKTLAAEVIKILILEDNPGDVLFLEETLKESPWQKFEPAVVGTLEEALSYLGRNSVDIILSDLGLPDATGLDVLFSLQTVARTCPIVILTGLDVELVAEQAVSRGAQDYLVKGQFDGRTLVRSLKYAVTRKRAEEFALRAVSFENVVLQEVLEQSPIGIARFDANMTLVNCNSVFAHLFSIDRHADVGKNMVMLMPVSGEIMWQTVEKGIPFRSPQHLASSKPNGESVVLDLTIWPVRTRESQIQGGIVLALDVSERIRLERQHEDFIALLAHDIKNPLLGADRVLTFLTSSSLSKEEHANIISLLKQSNSNVLAMLQNLLEIYRYDAHGKSVALSPLHVDAPIKNAVSLTAMAALAKNIKISISVPEELPLIYAEFTAIARLFCNLFDNSIRFSEQGSIVSLNAYAETPGRTVVIEVVDTGSGMTEAEQASIFTRFGESRARKYNGGVSSGLGLYLCKQIVEASHGTISCSSEAGSGTKFTVRFPQAPERNLTPEPAFVA